MDRPLEVPIGKKAAAKNSKMDGHRLCIDENEILGIRLGNILLICLAENEVGLEYDLNCKEDSKWVCHSWLDWKKANGYESH
jgi:hypothetical protein